MTSTSGDGRGARPSLSAEQLLTSVPSLAEIAQLRTLTLSTLPGASLTFDDVVRALHWARAEVAEGVSGAILIQGTDTIEETAYLLDLYWDQSAPLVVTGAMRSAQMSGADGPANLLAAVRVAVADTSRRRGVLVVMNDEIHAARWTRKIRASGPAAFASPSFGPVGYLDEGQPVYATTAVEHRALPLPDPFVAPRVALLETFLGDDGEILETLRNTNTFRGFVVAGFGVGHVSSSMAEVVERTAGSVPVVLATRTGAGSTHRNSYGFDGSESDLISRGAIPAGWLDARKARVLLTCLLAAGSDVRAEFAHRNTTL
jgi:L-asparaginase